MSSQISRVTARLCETNSIAMPELLPQRLQEGDDLLLDQHVERRGRLVGDDQLRAQRQRAGDADPLALAAAELAADSGSAKSLGQGDAVEQLPHLLPPLAPPTLPVWTASGSAMMLPTLRRGLSEEAGFWNTGWIWPFRPRRSRAAAPLACPRTGCRPRPARSSPRMQRTRVDLPEPDSPTRPRQPPAGIFSDTSVERRWRGGAPRRSGGSRSSSTARRSRGVGGMLGHRQATLPALERGVAASRACV